MDKGQDLQEVQRLLAIVRRLQDKENGCPWDSVQTHASIKPGCVEEAVEVIAGINIFDATGDATNLKEELGDLLLQVVFHAALAEKEGLFTLEDVAKASADKMVRRHPNIFHQPLFDANGKPVTEWSEIKKIEKAGREWEEDYLPAAFDEAELLLKKAKKRKHLR